MPRVIGIDPGTVSLDVCGLVDGRLDLDLTLPTADALADPERFIATITARGRPDLVAGPSGYGLPLTRAADATEADLRLAFLAGSDESGGIGGLRRLARRLGQSDLPVVYTPASSTSTPSRRTESSTGSISAPPTSWPSRRWRSSSSASALAARWRTSHSSCSSWAAPSRRRGHPPGAGGGRSAAPAARSGGARPARSTGEVAYLAGTIDKALLFQGGVETVARAPGGRLIAIEAYLEGAVKAVHQLRCSAPEADEVVVSDERRPTAICWNGWVARWPRSRRSAAPASLRRRAGAQGGAPGRRSHGRRRAHCGAAPDPGRPAGRSSTTST
jgi:hypothetical protein